MGPRPFLAIGPALFAAGLLLILPVTDTSDFWTFGVAGIGLVALGLSVFVAPITATAISSAPERYAGVASGVNTTVSRLGGLLAVAVIGLVIQLVFTAQGGPDSSVPLAADQMDPAVRSASIDAFRAGMGIAAGLALAGAIVGAVGIAPASRRAAEPPVTPPEPAGA
jgi:hypothetical protein